MADFRNESYRPLPMLIRMIACAVIIGALSMLEREGLYQEKVKIPVGYDSVGGEQMMNYDIEHRVLENNHFLASVYAYEDREEMMDALANEEISFALMDFTQIVFDNKMTDNRIILCIEIDNKYKIAVCVRKNFLETHLKTAARFVQAFLKENTDIIKVVPMHSFIAYCLSKGYSEEKIMQSTAPEFVEEIVKEGQF